jgi:tetratricopeptide (TPR) repeat protein
MEGAKGPRSEVKNTTDDDTLLSLIDEGDGLRKQGNQQKALDAYTKAVDRWPDFEPSYTRRAHVYTKIRDYSLALKLSKEIRRVAMRLARKRIRPEFVIAWSLWRRAHKAEARGAHLKKQL